EMLTKMALSPSTRAVISWMAMAGTNVGPWLTERLLIFFPGEIICPIIDIVGLQEIVTPPGEMFSIAAPIAASFEPHCSVHFAKAAVQFHPMVSVPSLHQKAMILPPIPSAG